MQPDPLEPSKIEHDSCQGSWKSLESSTSEEGAMARGTTKRRGTEQEEGARGELKPKLASEGFDEEESEDEVRTT